MKVGDPENVLLVWDRIGDYHRARIQALEDLVGSECVYYADLGAADGLYHWQQSDVENARYALLSEKPVEQADCRTRVMRFWRLLRQRRIERVALAGYGRKEYLAFMILARLSGCKVMVFAESWYGEGRLKNFCKGLFLRMFAHVILVSGERALQHFHNALKLPQSRLVAGYSVVDNEHFSRWQGQLEREPVILSVARFSPEKHLDLLIAAYLESRVAQRFRLRLIGGGPEEAALRALAGAHPSIEILPWVDYKELPEMYAKAALFALPSRFEPWGLVVNEAMAAGLPVLVSDACGCAPDLVHADNGWQFPAQDKAALVSLLDAISDLSDEQLASLGRCSRDKIRDWSCAHWAQVLWWATGPEFGD